MLKLHDPSCDYDLSSNILSDDDYNEVKAISSQYCNIMKKNRIFDCKICKSSGNIGCVNETICKIQDEISMHMLKDSIHICDKAKYFYSFKSLQLINMLAIQHTFLAIDFVVR